MIGIHAWGQGTGRITIINHNLYCNVEAQLTATDPGIHSGAPCSIKTNVFTVLQNSSTPTWTPADISASGPGFATPMKGVDLVNTTGFSWTDVHIKFHCDECSCQPSLSGEIGLSEMLLLPNQCNDQGVQAGFGTGCFYGPHTWTNVSHTTPMGDIQIDIY